MDLRIIRFRVGARVQNEVICINCMPHISTHLLKNQLLSTSYQPWHSPSDKETQVNKIDTFPRSSLPKYTESNHINKCILKT